MPDSSKNVIKDWINKSLIRKVGIGLVALAVLMLLAVSGVFFQAQLQQADATVINVAGRQRTLSQLIANRALRAANGEAQAINDLEAAADLFDRSLRGLRDGDAELGLPPAPASVWPELDAVTALWDPTYQNIQIVLETTSDRGQVRTLARNLVDRNEALVAASEATLIELEDADAPISTISFAQHLPLSVERINKLILEINEGQIGVAPQLAEEIKRFDEVLYLLITLGNDDDPAREQLLALNDSWMLFNADVQTLVAAAEEGLQANHEIIASSEQLLDAGERVTALFEQEAESKVVVLQWFLAGVAVVFLFVFGVVLWATRRFILPLRDMSHVATRIAEGDLTANVAINSRDEIGRLAEAFNSMTGQLRNTIDTLEVRVAERTRQLETVVGVSQRLSSILDLSDLMREVVTLTKESFNYYHVHIYLMDDAHENLIMAEGYGEAGAEMKRQRHHISLMSPRSLVARAARERKIITVENVQDDPWWLPNPLLPNTHSEMAVPVILDAEVAGVLDVQSEKIGGLTSEDEGILQILANQLATTLRNIGLFSETQEALVEAEKLQRLYTGQGWEKFTAVRSKTIYEVRRPTLPPLEEIAVPEAEAALQQMKTVNKLSNGDTNGAESVSDKVESTLATPLKLGNEVIGVLGIRDENPERQWTDDEIALIEAVSEQMSLALENARLVEETQRNAWRDRVVSESTARVWSTPDIEEVMKTAVSQLGDKLRASEVVIRLGKKDEVE